MYSYNYPRPAVTVDVVIFTIAGDSLQVLLVRRGREPFRGDWALPGGFVGLDESLKHAAWRELREETGVTAAYLEQLYTFGHPKRDPRDRVISVAYFSMIPAAKLDVRAASDADEVALVNVDEVGELAFDHARILRKARTRLAEKLAQAPIALQMMPDAFTLPELQRAFEAIGGAPIDKRNFRKRIRMLGVIEPTGEQSRAAGRRPARLYRVIDRMAG